MARLPLFVRTYKYLYVGMLVTNLLLTMNGSRRMDYLSNTDRRNIYAINVGTIGLNIISWYGYVRYFRWGLISERALSFGRILVTTLIGPLLLIDIALYSPVFLLVWNPLLALVAEVARRSPEWDLVPIWLPASTALLMAEVLYCWAIGATQAVHEQKQL